MERGCTAVESGLGSLGGRNQDIDLRILRSQLINLSLDWELEALALDAQRYRAQGTVEKESLRDSAQAYRKCIAKLTELLNDRGARL
jgi:hypothetical protein